MTPQTPRILEGGAPSVSMNSLDEFTIRTNGSQAERIEALYRTGSADVVHAAGGEMFEAMKILKSANPQQYVAAATAPTIRARRSASTCARSRSSSRRTSVSRSRSPTSAGGTRTSIRAARRASSPSASTTSRSRSPRSRRTSGTRMSDVTILTMSEFGRTARQNGNGGTDHGHATSMFIIGGDVKGKKVHGKWPGLEAEQLNEGRDLALTTDFRSVFSEVAFKHLGAAKMDAVFPGFKGDQKHWLGVL